MAASIPNLTAYKTNMYSSNTLVKLIQGNFMSNRQIAKKLLSTTMPNSSDKGLNLIVYGEDLQKTQGSSYKPYQSETNSNVEKTEATGNTYTPPPGSSYKPLPTSDPIFGRVGNLQTEILNAAIILLQKSSDLPKDIINLSTLITGSVVTISAFAVSEPIPNVTASLNLVLQILNEFNRIKQIFNDILPISEKLSNVDVLIKPAQLAIITTELNTIFGLLNTALKSFNSLPSMNHLQNIQAGGTASVSGTQSSH